MSVDIKDPREQIAESEAKVGEKLKEFTEKPKERIHQIIDDLKLYVEWRILDEEAQKDLQDTQKSEAAADKFFENSQTNDRLNNKYGAISRSPVPKWSLSELKLLIQKLEVDHPVDEVLDPTAYRESFKEDDFEMSVGYDVGYDAYILSFPQIDLSSASAQKSGVQDSCLRLTEDPTRAMKIFDHAAEIYEQCEDVYQLYNRVQEFSLNYRSESDT